MSMRSLVRFVDRRGDVILNLFRHYDGYPAHRGAILRDFLAVAPATDFDCQAVRYVAHELAAWIAERDGKDDGLTLRLYSDMIEPAATDCDYAYEVREVAATNGTLAFTRRVVVRHVGSGKLGWGAIFAGTEAEFAAYIATEERLREDRIAALNVG